MGYVTPITQYQYAQYQNREVGWGYDPFPAFPVERIKRVTTGSAASEDESTELEWNWERKEQPRKVIDSKTVEKVYGAITGKGKHFSDCI